MNRFDVIPAIDLKDGRCVRLRQGKADEVTVYSEDPVEMARYWVEQGAHWLHVVDLDGAFQGHPVHQHVIRKIVNAISIPVQVGGGLRTDEDMRTMLDAGVSRAVLGTRAFADPAGLENVIQRFAAKVAVGIDARDGRVQVKGWTETTDETANALARRAESLGVQTIIYTDTATDGMLQGTNTRAVDRLCRNVSCSVIASGGISSPADLENLCSLGHENLVGAIVGKALYESRVSLQELQRATAS